MLNYERAVMFVDVKRRRRGYTLVEVMTAMILVAVVVTLTYPSFTIQVKKIRSQEGVTVLAALYAAQKNYFEDTGAYASAAASLEVSIPAMQNFNAPVVYAGGTVACGGGTAVQMMASVADVNGEYTLYALVDGRIVCNPCAGICVKLGFSAW